MKRNWLKKLGCAALAAATVMSMTGGSLVYAGDDSGKKKELELWSLLDETDDMASAWENAVTDYEAAHSF